MTLIRTTCPRCGEVEMGPRAILLSITDERGEGSYRFLCPTCLDPVEKRADRKVIALLVSAGVDLAGSDLDETAADDHVDEVRAEPPESRPSGAPFTTDDLIAFHFLLQDDNTLHREFLTG